ncbi:MAG: maltose alpha-D-glucosyltransferase [Chloroflexota bacterium]|nr:maltose alpha-D-glucosyltransferase [Chloroflexota bacterium]
MDDTLWFKDAIFYEVPVRSFYDSSNDGSGDFVGLTQKLPYIRNLGVDCIWLLPFYPSPLRDDGYDIAEFYDIHPDYGTLDDFKAFLDRAHELGMRVIADMVLNHTSDQHQWFQEARRSPDSPYRDYYVWSDDPTLYKDARVIFTDTEISNWTFDPVAGRYYWHRFFSHQPDLNFENPAVQQAMLDVIAYWLGFGLDGFRCDAVPYLYERDGTNCENLPETHAYLKQVRRYVDEHFPGKILLAEANQWPADVIAYFGNGDEFHMAFHFPIMPRIFMAIRREERMPIVEIMEQTPDIPELCQWGMFLRNHDELTLEMVTDAERDYMYYEYAKDPRMKINIGIRRRLAPLAENGRRQIELLNSILLSMPGSPILYYGDEIGMGDNYYLGDRNGVRTPMQWSSDRNAGFSRADPARLYSPVVMDPVYGFQSINVEAQERTPTSLLNWITRLIRVRKKYPAFGRGSLEFLGGGNPKVLAYIRQYEGQTLLVVLNLSRFVQCAEVDLSRFIGMQPVELIGETHFPTITDRPYFFTLGPHAFYWFRLENMAQEG